MLPKLAGIASGAPLGSEVTPSALSTATRPAMVLLVPSVSVVVSASGRIPSSFGRSSDGTLRLKMSFAALSWKMNTVLNTC